MENPRNPTHHRHRQGYERRATKQKRLNKSEKLKELTELLKNNQTHSNQQRSLSNESSTVLNIESSQQTNMLSSLLCNKDLNNQSTMNDFQSKKLNMDLSYFKKPYYIRLINSGSTLPDSTPFNARLFLTPPQQEIRLLSGSCCQKDILIRSVLFSHIEQTDNLKDKTQQRRVAEAEYTLSSLNASGNKRNDKLLFVQLQYEKQNRDNNNRLEESNNSYFNSNSNSNSQLKDLSLNMITNQEENNLSEIKHNPVTYSCVNGNTLKATRNALDSLNAFQLHSKSCNTPVVLYDCPPKFQNTKTILFELVEVNSDEKTTDHENQEIIKTDLICHKRSSVENDDPVSSDENFSNTTSPSKESKQITSFRCEQDGRNKKAHSSNFPLNCLDSKTEEKIRTDKSKRRKGIYIESPDWTDTSQIHQRKQIFLKDKCDELKGYPSVVCYPEETVNLTGSTNFSTANTQHKFTFQNSKQKNKNKSIFENGDDGFTKYSDRHSDSNISNLKVNYDILAEKNTKSGIKDQIVDRQIKGLYPQLFKQTKALSTPTSIEYVGDMDKMLKETLSNLKKDKKYHIKFKHAILEAILSHIKYYTRSSSICSFLSQPNLSTNDIYHNQSKNLSHETSLSESRRKKSKQKVLFSKSKVLVELIRGSQEKLMSEQIQTKFTDTRTHIAEEIYRNEQSYVESLQTVVLKYLNVLKLPEYSGMIEPKIVDEIFFMVPDILAIHEKFLMELKKRLDSWVPEQKVGDAFVEIFSKTEVLEVYTSFVNNCNRAKNAIRTAKQLRPSFARFLEATAREHKGKLTLDNLLIKPVQKFPNYEMLFSRLMKHTVADHPDQKHIETVLKLVHDILLHINCKEKEILENDQREATLRELENIIEGITDLNTPDRHFIIFDVVSMRTAQSAKKERGLFLFNDFLLITSVKRRSGTIRKLNASSCPASIAMTLDSTKYKCLTKVSLENIENIKFKEEAFRRESDEFEQLLDDSSKLQQIAEVAATIKYPHQVLEDMIRDIHLEVQNLLSEHQLNESRLNMLDITINSQNGSQHLEIIFSTAEKRSLWEEAFNEAKQKLAATLERHQVPEFVTSIPIVKTRAGLQFTCAEPTLRDPKEVWVCNSDGYVGQVCVMSLSPEPNVTSCNGVCNARILCLASAPAYSESKSKRRRRNSSNCDNSSDGARSSSPKSSEEQNKDLTGELKTNIKFDSISSSDDSEQETVSHSETLSDPINLTGSTTPSGLNNQENSDVQGSQSTMWLGTEDGFVHVYNCNDAIRIKKNKIKIQHSSAVLSILHMDNRVFVSLANGDLCVYHRENGVWNTNSPLCISIGSVSSPVTKLLSVSGKLWCSIQGIVKVLDTKTLQVVQQIQVSSDSKPITNMTISCKTVWISVQNSAYIKCFHATTYLLLSEVNLGPAVNKMLSSCDDIIRQHKAACLRVTSLLSCKDLIWVGTSAGVLLTISAHGSENGTIKVVPSGLPYGHTGHVRFLTFVETSHSLNESSTLRTYKNNQRYPKHFNSESKTSHTLVISGGDGFEDFRSSGANSLSEIAGRKDSTNHLIVWQI